MPRPKKPRKVCFYPDITYFKPRGVPLCELEEVVLTDDEVESLKLHDIDRLEQKQAASQMKISQPTFARILTGTYQKIADALINGKAIKMAIIVLLFLTIFFIPSVVMAQEESLEGKVVDIVEQDLPFQKLKIEITKGSKKNSEIIIESGNFPLANQPVYSIGDNLVINYTKNIEGNDSFFISDYVRRIPMFILFVIFIFLTALIGKLRGLTSLLGMMFSFLVIFLFILPQILKGGNPTTIAIIGSVIIIPLTFYLSHGFNRKTTVSVVGTVISLVITGLLAHFFVEATKLTGFASEEAGFLQFNSDVQINIKGLLLAGIIIGVLGVLDDITISQSAIVAQLKKANPKLKIEELYKRAMDVGQDHISSMVNTLILVYTGASLPLLLIFIGNPHPFSEIINYELVADEIVRTLVGSIGLILAVPITTFISVLTFDKKIG